MISTVFGGFIDGISGPGDDTEASAARWEQRISGDAPRHDRGVSEAGRDVLAVHRDGARDEGVDGASSVGEKPERFKCRLVDPATLEGIIDSDAPASILDALIEAEERREPALKMEYGCKSFTPQTTCEDIHRAPYPRDSRRCCAVCHRSGCDHYACLQRDPKADPKPEPKPTKYKPGKVKGGKS